MIWSVFIVIWLLSANFECGGNENVNIDVGKTQDKLRNDFIGEIFGVISIEDKVVVK